MIAAGWGAYGAGSIAALLLAASPALAQTSAPPGCLERLASAGIAFEPIAPPPAPAPAANAACQIAEPVRLVSVVDAGEPTRRILFPDRPTLTCALAERFGRFTAEVAAPLALGVHGRRLAAISTGPGHECRPRNRVAGAKMSSHGRGEAVDIMGAELADGQKIMVELAFATPEAARFFSGLRAAACGAFSTVLGPGSDASHANHLHIDIEARGRDGLSKFCQ